VIVEHTTSMRLAAAALLVLAAAVPAAAADVHPRTLALRQADVPSGFEVDREKTGVRSNASELRKYPELAGLFTKVGRVTGYSAEFRRGSAFIGSRADLVRRPAGARALLDWYDREIRKGGVGGLKRARGGVGAESWLFWEESTKLTLVAWRYQRVFAAVLGTDLTKEQTLGLARAQQRRIAAALD
jgi:hypothetical protein